jgi:hypothetical protein
MAVVDYTLLYRDEVELQDLAARSTDWDLFLSAYNASERVQRIFETVQSPTKHWVVHPEYRYDSEELPADDVFAPASLNEAEFWSAYLADAQPALAGRRICVDLTGFMRPHLMFLVHLLFLRNVTRFTALYTDPERYVREENTEFTKGPVVEVRQVAGFEGVHEPDTSNDLLIIGAGYDDELIRRVAESKANARKLELFGLPSLQPDMYQQSVIRAARAAEAVGAAAETDVLFAPANDPFVTAQVLRDRVKAENQRRPITNLYLTSLGTKPQALGFALYFLTERRRTATSMLFPYAQSYTRETTKGIARTWVYEVELLPA